MGSMILDDYFRQYGLIATFIAVAVVVPIGMLMASYMMSLLSIRPKRPSFVKGSIYECGFEALSGRWSQFNFRHYSLALDFVVFDVEVVYLFPWAAAFSYLAIESGLGLSYFLPMMGFMGVLVLGWIYAWRKGSLNWS